MAKLFYTLEEAAEKLGIGEEQIKKMASNHQLQPFIDGEKLMFKRDQVDGMAASGGAGGLDDTGEAAAISGGDIPLADSAAGGIDALGGSGLGSSGLLSALGSGLGSGAGAPDTDEGTGLIDLAGDPAQPAGVQDASQGSGVSVFDAGEVEIADPSAQTMMSDPGGTMAPDAEGDELALESVGSGSGLLDLTREADDTSLGAELLDEIYPGAEETSGAEQKTAMETASDTSDVFDGSVTLEAKEASGIELPSAIAVAETEPLEGAAPMVSMPTDGEGPYDAAGSGMSSGFMLGGTIVLILGLIVAVFAIGGIPNALTVKMTQSQEMLYYYLGGALAVWLVMGLVGTALGKMMNK